MKRKRAICRQRPWSRRPNQSAHAVANTKLFRFLVSNNGKFYPNRWAHVIFIFHFRFSQRRAVINAPVNRLQPAIHIPLFEKCDERIGHRRFITWIHREVRLFPLPKNAQPLKLPPMRIDVTGRKLPAHPSKLRRRDFVRFPAKLFFNFCLDRQTVTVPARNVRRTKPSHGL